MIKIIVMFVVYLMSSIALGESGIPEIPDVPDSAPWWLSMFTFVIKQFPEFNGWFAAAMIFIMAGLRSASELLNFIAKKTETKTDDEIARQLTKVIKWISAIIGWFGLGKPKS